MLNKLTWIEEFVNELLDPAGRALRRRAIESLEQDVAAVSSRASILTIKSAHRHGWVLAIVTDVLKAASGPMRARAIHAAAEALTGEPVSWSSVKNCLVDGTRSRSPKFERVGRGTYQLAR